MCLFFFFFFFFEAEDGIRDYKVTGVQTCVLPISPTARARVWLRRRAGPARRRSQTRARAVGAVRVRATHRVPAVPAGALGPRARGLRRPSRSEERRVGKACSDERSGEQASITKHT